jgi:hypothetical protein
LKLDSVILTHGKWQRAIKAIPVLAGRYFNNSIIASNPPADAPMATTGNGASFTSFVAGYFFLFGATVLYIKFSNRGAMALLLEKGRIGLNLFMSRIDYCLLRFKANRTF